MRGKILLLAAGLALAASAAALPAQAAGKALIIGVDKYRHVKPLIGSGDDARAMRDFAIQRWGFAPADVLTLTDGEATQAAILGALDRWLVDGTKRGDTVLFYFSGHGYFVPDRDGDEKARDPADGWDEVLVAVDGRANRDGYEGMVLDDEIAARLKKLKDRRVVMLFDTCHSGTMTRSVGGGSGGMAKTPDLAPIVAGMSRSVSDADYRGAQRIQPDMTDGTDAGGQVVAFYAASSTEQAMVNLTVNPPRGVFTEAFLRGAAGAADASRNGVVSLAEIDSFVRAEAKAYCSSNQCTTGMTPYVEAPAAMMAKDLITLAQAPALQQAAVDAVGPGSTAAPVKVAFSPAGPVPIGREIKIAVTSPIDGNLVLIDLPPDNAVHLLFPNKHSERARNATRRVKAGETIWLPPERDGGYTLPATPPAGPGSVLALVIQDDIPFARLERLIETAKNQPPSRGGFAPIADPLSFLGELGKALVVPWTGELTTRGVKWAMGHYEYEIVK